MNEADRRFTPYDAEKLKTFLKKEQKGSTTASSAELYLKNLPKPQSVEPFIAPSDEDFQLLNSKNLLLSWFFEDYFQNSPTNSSEADPKNFQAGFYLWQDILEEDFLMANSPTSIECADLTRSLSLADTYAYAKIKLLKLGNERRKEFIGTENFRFISESYTRWKNYENIAHSAFKYDASLSKQ